MTIYLRSSGNMCLVWPRISQGSLPEGGKTHNHPQGIHRIYLRKKEGRESLKWAEEQEKRQNESALYQWETLRSLDWAEWRQHARTPANGPTESISLLGGAHFVQEEMGSREGPLSRGIEWGCRCVRRLCNSKMIWRWARESFKEAPAPRRPLQWPW